MKDKIEIVRDWLQKAHNDLKIARDELGIIEPAGVAPVRASRLPSLPGQELTMFSPNPPESIQRGAQ